MKLSRNYTQPNRLEHTGLLNTSERLSFRFDGVNYYGYAGDTLASALLANGVRVVGRSFKYHRPRGILSAGIEEPNALVEVGEGARKEPNLPATLVELYDGLQATSQNRWPSLSVDLLSINQLFAPILTAGFYYKTFMWPRSFWEKLYEPIIRRAAGLGRASGKADPDRYESANAFCDVLVIGSGPSGLAAALAAARAGARVILCENDFVLGGRLNGERTSIDGKPGKEFAEQAEAELRSLSNVRVFTRTQVFGVYDGREYAAVQRLTDHISVPDPNQPRQRLWRIVARRCINAMGALERPMAFAGNDRPGVMLATAVRTYLNRFAVVAGNTVAIYTATDAGWQTLDDLLAAGVPVKAVVDTRLDVPDHYLSTARSAGVPVHLGSHVSRSFSNRQGISGVEIVTGAARTRYDIDCLAVSGGWDPQIALTTHLGGKPIWSENLQTFLPGHCPDGMVCVGAVAGHYSTQECLDGGARAGAAAAHECDFPLTDMPSFQVSDAPTEQGNVHFSGLGDLGKTFVDLQNDVTAKDLMVAHAEGFRSVEHLKRYTTLGMATDQGKTSNALAHSVLSAITGRDARLAGRTVLRPPYAPVSLGVFAGHHRYEEMRPTRKIAIHSWAIKNGATMIESGLWLRPQWYTLAGETEWVQSATREVNTVRTKVGFTDVSTLGKIDIQGPDVGAFLDLVYINTFSNLPVGRAKYGLMLREDGIAFDDGTTARLSETKYIMSTSTAHAASVMQHLEFCRLLRPDMRVTLNSVTEQWSQFAIAGPKSRDVLEALFGDEHDLSDLALPFMGCLEFKFRNVMIRLFRISFSGELAYEIAVPSMYGESFIELLSDSCKDFGGCPYGTEAMGIMRIEKGHIAGAELNGQTTAADLGMEKLMAKKKDFIGRVMASRPALLSEDREMIVGLRARSTGTSFNSGAHLLTPEAATSLSNSEGHITSTAYSPTLGVSIGLGLLKGGVKRHGQTVRAFDAVRGIDIELDVVPQVFVDPEGSRLRG